MQRYELGVMESGSSGETYPRIMESPTGDMVKWTDHCRYVDEQHAEIEAVKKQLNEQCAIIGQQSKEIARLREVLDKLQAKRFPIMKGPSVLWIVMEPHEAMCETNHHQSLKRLAERGGLSPAEAWCVVSGINLNRMRTTPLWDEYEAEWKKFAERVNHIHALGDANVNTTPDDSQPIHADPNV